MERLRHRNEQFRRGWSGTVVQSLRKQHWGLRSKCAWIQRADQLFWFVAQHDERKQDLKGCRWCNWRYGHTGSHPWCRDPDHARGWLEAGEQEEVSWWIAC